MRRVHEFRTYGRRLGRFMNLRPAFGYFPLASDSPGTMDCAFQALNRRIGENATVGKASAPFPS
jgi:hypothetical protein